LACAALSAAILPCSGFSSCASIFADTAGSLPAAADRLCWMDAAIASARPCAATAQAQRTKGARVEP
jgi:hypothetical protein